MSLRTTGLQPQGAFPQRTETVLRRNQPPNKAMMLLKICYQHRTMRKRTLCLEFSFPTASGSWACKDSQFVVIHIVRGFNIVNEEVDLFLEFSCFFYDPVDVGYLISGCSAFSKSSLNIWKFSVHVLLQPSLENFEHYFAIV